jgi:glycyl-tRNA synthetase
MKVPFGIAQTGKAFRNEIVARQFIFRMRSLNKWKCNFCASRRRNETLRILEEARLKWHLSLGKENYHDHEKLAHYANAAADIEFNFPLDSKLEGIHSRTDFDLKHTNNFG